MKGLLTLSLLTFEQGGGRGKGVSLEWFLRSLLGRRGRKPFGALQSSHCQRVLSKVMFCFPLAPCDLLNDSDSIGWSWSDWYPQTSVTQSRNSPERLFPPPVLLVKLPMSKVIEPINGRAQTQSQIYKLWLHCFCTTWAKDGWIHLRD